MTSPGNRQRLPALALAVALLAGACLQPRYVVQAGLGQLELWGRARPISAVITDRNTDERLRIVLEEVGEVLAYAEARGLASQGNYRKYVDLDRDAVVWFMTASPPLALEPKVWGFPIVGSFPYLGWFDYREALKVRGRLIAAGWDVYVREVRAYSTGGWFRDPVLSTMISDRDDALRSLVNVLFHELTHANLLVADQSTFNESIAVFVGDTMAIEYLADRFGAGSPEHAALVAEIAEERAAGARLARAYRELQAIYASARSDPEKLRAKRELLGALQAEFSLSYSLNNAAMVGFKTYNSGLAEFEALYRACGESWARFFAVVERIDSSWFPEEQVEEIAPIIQRAVDRGCPEPRRMGRRRSELAAEEREAPLDPALPFHAARHHVELRKL